MYLMPESDSTFPTLTAVAASAGELDSVLSSMRGFLSALCWARHSRYAEIAVVGTGGKAMIGKVPGERVRPWVAYDHFALGNLPDPSDTQSRLALALYREGANSNSVLYGFLCFYKVINIQNADWHKQVAWINRTVPLLTDGEAVERLRALQGQNVGEYLHLDGRCAIAHANSQPLVNPEDPNDLRRLRLDIRLMRSLAEYAIEKEVGGGLSTP